MADGVVELLGERGVLPADHDVIGRLAEIFNGLLILGDADIAVDQRVDLVVDEGVGELGRRFVIDDLEQKALFLDKIKEFSVVGVAAQQSYADAVIGRVVTGDDFVVQVEEVMTGCVEKANSCSRSGVLRAAV